MIDHTVKVSSKYAACSYGVNTGCSVIYIGTAFCVRVYQQVTQVTILIVIYYLC